MFPGGAFKRILIGKVPRLSCPFMNIQRSYGAIDLSEPHLWFPEAREMGSRRVICHVGGTNSGKTYMALSALAAARNGMYCGPLRLLAWEVSETLRGRDIRCSLVTGNEKSIVDAETHVSCTVEMADLSRRFEIAVIDEAQLLGDSSRGWAWTQAFLGLKANEIHLCGSTTMLPIVRNLCEKTGDTLEVREYSRLAPLEIRDDALDSYTNVEPGDCVVGFSRKSLYEIKREIETVNPDLRCCVIYGGLPPEARRKQAELFSAAGSGFDVLVASDAIGMGLNLAIKRIIFSTLGKFDGKKRRALHSYEIKQIAGRAGRYGSFDFGEVLCLEADDVPLMRRSMKERDKDVVRAGLFPTLEQLSLLGVMIDYRVDDSIMDAFWRDHFDRKWSLSGGDGDSDDDKNGFAPDTAQRVAAEGLSTALVKMYFRNMNDFARSLELFLTTTAEYETHADIVTGKIDRKLEQRNRIYRLRPFYDDGKELAISSNGDRLGGATTEEELVKPGEERSSSTGIPRDSYIDNYDRFGVSKEFRDPITVTLSGLLSMFRRRVDMDDSGLYFLCDLTERAALADAIDDVRMNFKTRYLFCMAPVDFDNEAIMKKFRRFAVEFSDCGKVRLYDSVMGIQVPKTPLELLDLETAHRIFDLYLWLGNRFPGAFVDIEQASIESRRCADLADRALQTFGTTNKRFKKPKPGNAPRETSSRSTTKDTEKLNKQHRRASKHQKMAKGGEDIVFYE